MSLLFSKEIPYEDIVFGGAPSGIIDGCVNAITGSFFINEDDWVVNGHEPIPIRRRYLSSEDEEEKFGGWEFFFHHLVATRVLTKVTNEAYPSNDGVEYLQHFHYDLYLPEKYGFSLVYEGEIFERQRDNCRYKLKKPYPKSITNCFAGEIGARLNAFNNQVYTDANNYRVILIDAADGTKRAYECIDKNEYYYLKHESLPNSNKIHYRWESVLGKRRLTGITTTDATGQKQYASVGIDYKSNDGEHLNAIKLTTSDNHEIIYHIRNQKHGKSSYWLVDRIENSGRPNESYRYWGPKKKEGCPLSERRLQLGSYIQPSYFNIGEAGIRSENDAKFKRVKSLASPVKAENPQPVTFLTISYEPGKYDKGAGATSVRDFYGNLTHYYYDKHFLLQNVKYMLRNQELFLEEQFEWGAYSKTEGHSIKSRKLFGKGRKHLRTTTYHYDKWGNVSAEELIGNLKGLYPQTKSSESFTIKYSYNEKNLVTEEMFPNGKKIVYRYVPGTHLIAKKFIFDRSELKMRHLYFYEGSFLKCEITDDGSSQNPNDLNDVTIRLVREYFPKQQEPFRDLPAAIEERYYDSISGTEKLLFRQEVLQFNQHGHPEKIVYFDANNKERYILHFSYDEQGRLLSQSDPFGREKKLDYDGNGNIIFHQTPQDPLPSLFRYDLINRLIEKQEHRRKWTYEYNYLHHVIKEVDFRGNATHIKPNRFGHPLETTLPQIIDVNGFPQSPQFRRKFNSLGKAEFEVDPEGNQTKTYYTCRGTPYRIIHPDLSEEYCTYDLLGNLKTHVSPNGIKTEYEYDFLDRVTSKKVYSQQGELLSEEYSKYNAFNLIEKTASNGIKTLYTYDGAGRKVKEEVYVEGCPKITRYEYDELGRLYKTIHQIDDLRAQIIKQTYDLLNRLQIERELDQNGTEYSITKYTYDDYDRQTASSKEVQVGKSISRTDYDHFGRITKETDPHGHSTTIDYDDDYLNTLGQKVLNKTTTNPNGVQTIEVFDAHDNLSTLLRVDERGQPLLLEEFFYNLNNQKVQQTSTLYNSQKTITKAWDYDSRGRLKKLTECPGEAHEKKTTYRYDLDGNLLELTKPSGLIITYAYDGLGRKTSVKTSDGTCDYELRYDQMGNITIAKNCLTGAITKRTYDHFRNLLTDETEYGLTTTRTYDALGRKTQLKLPDSSFVQYHYDSYHLTAIKRVEPTGHILYEHAYSNYDKSHNLLSEYLIGDLGIVEYQVDLSCRRVTSSSPFIHEEVTQFDPNGNLLGINRKTLTVQESQWFSYNALDQMIQEEGPFAHTYQFDAHHDRMQKDQASYETNPLHEIHQAGHINFEHDFDGNLSQEKTSNQQVEFVYDGLDRLIEIRSLGQVHCFHYDFFNRLLSQKTLKLNNKEWSVASEKFYLYDGQNELGAFPHELRILGQGRGAEIGATIAIEKHGKVYVPLHDLFGNILALIDINTHGLAESYSYSAFGEERIFSSTGKKLTSSSIGNPWRYQSKRRIESLICFGRRFYYPEIGRWISPDPKGFDEGPNLYQFNLNNPFRYIDLYGEEIAEFWRHFAGPDHDSLDPMERIENRTLEWVALLNAIGSTFGDIIDQARLEMHKLGSPTLIDLEQQETVANQIENKIDEVFPYDKDNSGYQMVYTAARLGVDANLMLLGSIASEGIRSKKILDVSKIPTKNLTYTISHKQFTLDQTRIGNYKYSKGAYKHFDEVVKRGKFKGELARPYMRSIQAIEEIMSAKKPIPDPLTTGRVLRWEVEGAFRGSEGVWELIANPESKMIYHFQFKSF